MDNPLKIEYPNKSIEWIDDLINEEAESNSLNRTLPNIYTNYFKLFFPVGLILNEKDDHPTQFSYKELAKRIGLEFKSNFSCVTLMKKSGKVPSNFVVLKENDEKFISGLIHILGSETQTIFEGFGDDVVPDEFQRRWKINGGLGLLKDIFNKLNKDNYHEYNHFPNYIYAVDKKWCMGTLIFQGGVMVLGCNKTIADKIRNQSVVDFQEINYEEEYFEFLKG